MNEEKLDAETPDTEKCSEGRAEKEEGCGCQSKKEAKKECKGEGKRLREENSRLAEKCDALEADLSELTDKYTRMLAEYDNFRKRAQKEREGVYFDATSDVINAILPIKDSLEMALKFADESQLSQGVTMTLNKFGEILTKLGVEEFGARGEEFDPNLHNGVLHCEDDELGEQIIAEVLQKGYKKGEKIIRYAMVKVAN